MLRTNCWLFGIILIAFCAGFSKVLRRQPPALFQVGSVVSATGNPPARFQSQFASSKLHTEAHAVSLVELKDGRIRAFWYSGSREGAQDVEIHTAVFNPGNGHWNPEQAVATRKETQRSLLRYVRKLGNPVCGRAADGKLWLFYVTVSVGGWSGSSITAKTSSDEGETWSPARRLVTAPFLDVSTLVKGTPFLYSDGTMGLPVYQELNNEFGEILRIDKAGKVIDKVRLSAGRDNGLQPVVLVKNAHDALVLMRHSGEGSSHQIIAVSTNDAGQLWTAPRQLPLSNPDSAISAIVLPDKRILAVVNNQGYQGQDKGRDALTLVISADGGISWKTIYQFENQVEAQKGPLSKEAYLQVAKKFARLSDPQLAGTSAANVDEYAESAQHAMCGADGCGFEFSYPYLIQTHNGDFHLAYTWNRSFIKHIWFNQTWLNQRLKESTP